MTRDQWKDLNIGGFRLPILVPHWKKAKKVKLSTQDWFDKYRALERDEAYSIASTKNGSEWQLPRYRVDEYMKRVGLYVNEGGDLYIYTTRADGFKDNLAPGRSAIKIVADKFKELNGIELDEAFPCLDKKKHKDLIIEFSRCTPLDVQVPSEDLSAKGRVYLHGGQVDGCSQYPTAACGKMPDLNIDTWIYREGWVEEADLPEGYDYELSLKSGHVLERGRFDSHELMERYPDKWDCFFRTPESKNASKNKNMAIPLTPKADERVVLMKSSPYELTGVMKFFYQEKEKRPHGSAEYASAKLVMNAFIGALGPNTENLYPGCKCRHPLRAIVLWRAAQSIMAKASEIGWEHVIDISVDGILYAFPKRPRKYGKDGKAMGEYHQEVHDCRLCWVEHNVYAFSDKLGNVFKVKHGAFDAYKGRKWDDDKNHLDKVEDVIYFGKSRLQKEMTEVRDFYKELKKSGKREKNNVEKEKPSKPKDRRKGKRGRKKANA